MGKLLLISFNLFIIMASKLYFGGDVSVTEVLPEYAKPGDTFEVQIEIEKGDREGFAKWQQAIPQGFIATKGETEGGTFSFKNQEIKIIWLALPQTEKFVVTFTLQSEPSLLGEFKFNGKFSYIEENERKEVIVEEQTITISQDIPEIAEAMPPKKEEDLPEESDEQGQNEAEVEEVQEVETDQMGSPATDNIALTKQVLDNENIKVKRSITHVSEGFYEVELEIDKRGFESFGKVEEFIPPNYTASAMENEEGIFSFSKNVMKIMWMTLPEENIINVKYGLQSTSDELDSATVFGVFSYLEVDQSRQLKLAGSKFKNHLSDSENENILVNNTEDLDSKDDTPIQNSDLVEEVESVPPPTEVIADNESEEIEETVDEVIEDEIIDTIEEVDPANDDKVINDPIEENNTTASTEEDIVEAITNIPAPETAISYRVQIAAAKREVQQQYFIDRHNINEEVAIQSHEGWYKYTIGSYNIYKAARDKRNQIWGEDNKINDAFVTAYNDGVRISVQEALMVSKQKWYN